MFRGRSTFLSLPVVQSEPLSAGPAGREMENRLGTRCQGREEQVGKQIAYVSFDPYDKTMNEI